MRVLILADEIFASRERVMLSRLEVGLADEGVRIVHAVPERLGRSVRPELVSQTVFYAEALLPFGDRFRVARLLRDIERAAGDEPSTIDVIHVFGGAGWHLARLTAEKTGAALALEVWRSGLAARAGHTPWTDMPDAVFLAPDPAIERILRDAGAGTVRPAYWGVHAAESCRPILAEDRLPGIMVVGGGRDGPAMRAVVDGLAAAREAGADFFAFFDSTAAHRAGAWGHAERRGLLDRISLIDELEDRRDLLLRGDVLVHPDHAGEQRSILLDAMGAGMAVIAAEDPNVSILQEGRSCRLVKGRRWADALRATLGDREATRQLARHAWEFVKAERPAARYVQAVLDTYSWLTAKTAIPFPTNQ